MTQLTKLMTAPTIFGGDIFDEAFRSFGLNIFQGNEPYNVSVNEDGDTILEFALVGFDKKDIRVFLKGRKLTVEADRKDNNSDKEYVHRKICSRSIKKTFDLSDKADKENIYSEYKNGLLTIFIPINKKEKEELQIKVK
jgi:HSP20 family protein